MNITIIIFDDDLSPFKPAYIRSAIKNSFKNFTSFENVSVGINCKNKKVYDFLAAKEVKYAIIKS